MAELVPIQARTLLRRSKLTDGWFLSSCGMNLYRGCEHGCAYCDGRAEAYRIEGDFASRIEVKVNAPELLARELARLPRRGFVLLGGGVCDAYQPAEAGSGLARRCLELLAERELPVHVLTKSPLVARDLDLLARIDSRARTILSLSVSAVDPEVAALLEPGCAPPEERFRVLEQARARGIATGVMLTPVLPWLSDAPAQLDAAFARARAAGVDFLLVGGLTLKAGRQLEHFLTVLSGARPELVPRYRGLYPADRFGSPRGGPRLDALALELARRHRLAPRIPHRVFRGVLELAVEAGLVLEGIATLHALAGEPRRAAPLLRAARSLKARREDLRDLIGAGLLAQVPDLDDEARALTLELVETGRCRRYEQGMPDHS